MTTFQVLTSRKYGVATVWYEFGLFALCFRLMAIQASGNAWLKIRLEKDKQKGHSRC